MLGSVKMEAHDLTEWSYYPEAGEVCPWGWRSGEWGAGVGLRASRRASRGCGVGPGGSHRPEDAESRCGSRGQGDEAWENDLDPCDGLLPTEERVRHETSRLHLEGVETLARTNKLEAGTGALG